MSRHEPGYLYAVMPEGGDSTRIKLGSTGAEDPVHGLKNAYSRAYGYTRVLWIFPCADMDRDEKERMHEYFGDRRIWPRREIFTFAGVDELLSRLRDFEVHLTALLRDEPCPPRITDLEGAATTAARREANKRKRSAEREADRRRRAAERVAEAEREQAEQSQQQRRLLQQVIEELCVLGSCLSIPSTVFNGLAKARGVCHGIKNAMAEHGHKLSPRKIEGVTVNVYLGLALKSTSV